MLSPLTEYIHQLTIGIDRWLDLTIVALCLRELREYLVHHLFKVLNIDLATLHQCLQDPGPINKEDVSSFSNRITTLFQQLSSIYLLLLQTCFPVSSQHKQILDVSDGTRSGKNDGPQARFGLIKERFKEV